MSSSKMYWGGILIIVGILALLLNFNVLGESFYGALYTLWPILVIAIGFGIIFKRHHGLKFLVWILAFSVLIYFSVFSDQYPFIKKVSLSELLNFTDQIVVTETKTSELSLEDPKDASLSLQMSSGEIDIQSSDDTSTRVTAPVDYSETKVDTVDQVNAIQVTEKENVGSEPIGMQHNYDFELDASKEWTIALNADMVSADINLRGLAVPKFNLNAAAGNATVTFGEVSDYCLAEFNIAASDLRLVVPKDIGIKITINSGLNDLVLDEDFKKVDNVYSNQAYENADKKIDIIIGSAIGTFNIEYESNE